MSAMDQLHIADAQHTTETTEDVDLEGDAVRAPDFYAEATEPRWKEYGRQVGGFIKSLLPELGKEEFLDDRRSVHHFEQLEDLRLVDELDVDLTDDADLGVLFALPDQSLLFVGSDPTSKETAPIFGFMVEPFEPIPAPTSAQEALDLLKPPTIREAFENGGPEPARQGEWFLLPTDLRPVSTVFRPGVNSRPYGPSPLDNHIPREYAFTVSDREFMERFRERAPSAPDSIVEPPEAIDWIYRAHFFDGAADVELDSDVPGWSEVQELADTILVRGSFRHRENEHFMENVGDQWHEAHTHDVDVYTADGLGRNVRLD